jgi:hypothetical protein
MTVKIKPKRSTVAGKIPTTTDLEIGEIALNLTDRVLYARDGSGAIVTIGGSSSVGELDDLTDVVITSPANNEVLAWDTTTGTWINQTASEAGLATESYVSTEIANLVASAPTTLDTLNELAAALNDDANFAGTMTTALGLKANSADLGTAAYTSASAYATSTQGSHADTAYGWGDHSVAGYITASSTSTLTNKSGNISQWTNDSGYITSADGGNAQTLDSLDSSQFLRSDTQDEFSGGRFIITQTGATQAAIIQTATSAATALQINHSAALANNNESGTLIFSAGPYNGTTSRMGGIRMRYSDTQAHRMRLFVTENNSTNYYFLDGYRNQVDFLSSTVQILNSTNIQFKAVANQNLEFRGYNGSARVVALADGNMDYYSTGTHDFLVSDTTEFTLGTDSANFFGGIFLTDAGSGLVQIRGSGSNNMHIAAGDTNETQLKLETNRAVIVCDNSERFIFKSDGLRLIRGIGHDLLTNANTSADSAIAVNENFQSFTLDQNTTFSFSGGLPGGSTCTSITIRITQGASAYTVSWPSSVKWPGGITPVVSTGAGDVDIITLVTYDAGTNWYGSIAQDFS